MSSPRDGRRRDGLRGRRAMSISDDDEGDQINGKPLVLLANGSRVSWTAAQRIAMAAHAARYRLSPSTMKTAGFGTLFARLFGTSPGTPPSISLTKTAVGAAKVHSALAYLLKRLHSQRKMCVYTDPMDGSVRANWPAWTRRWAEAGWDGDEEPPRGWSVPRWWPAEWKGVPAGRLEGNGTHEDDNGVGEDVPEPEGGGAGPRRSRRARSADSLHTLHRHGHQRQRSREYRRRQPSPSPARTVISIADSNRASAQPAGDRPRRQQRSPSRAPSPARRAASTDNDGDSSASTPNESFYRFRDISDPLAEGSQQRQVSGLHHRHASAPASSILSPPALPPSQRQPITPQAGGQTRQQAPEDPLQQPPPDQHPASRTKAWLHELHPGLAPPSVVSSGGRSEAVLPSHWGREMVQIRNPQVAAAFLPTPSANPELTLQGASSTPEHALTVDMFPAVPSGALFPDAPEGPLTPLRPPKLASTLVAAGRRAAQRRREVDEWAAGWRPLLAEARECRTRLAELTATLVFVDVELQTTTTGVAALQQKLHILQQRQAVSSKYRAGELAVWEGHSRRLTAARGVTAAECDRLRQRAEQLEADFVKAVASLGLDRRV